MNPENNQILPKKKSWFRRHLILTVLGVLVLLGIIGSLGKDNAPTTTSTEQTSSAQESTSTSGKSYQEVFKFSGNGIKKSEPFTIQGDRFKIAYDCHGDPGATLCTAFVFKVGSSLPQGVMNSTQSVKDETVIYTNLQGKGEYYLDANTMGNFTMTVYEYK